MKIRMQLFQARVCNTLFVISYKEEDGKPQIHLGTDLLLSRKQVHRGGGMGRGAMPPIFSKSSDSRNSLFCRKIFGLLLLVKMRASDFIGKSFYLPHILYRCYDTSACKHIKMHLKQ